MGIRRLLTALLLISTLSAQDADPLAGRWEGGGVALTLIGVDSYQVEVEALGAKFPGEASYDGASLDGSFTSDGEEFFFQARLQEDGTLRLETEQTVYELKRISSAPAPEQPTRNPLALAAKQPPPPPPPDDGREAFGAFRIALPEGWTGSLDPQGGVQLTAPGMVADGSEAYALAFIPDIDDPMSVQAVGAAGALLGQAAQIARTDSAELDSAGRSAALHQLVLEQLGRRLNAYMAAIPGGLLTIFASGVDAKVQSRDADLRSLLDSTTVDAEAAARTQAERQQQQQAPDGERLSVRTAPNAPAFVAGQTSDGGQQSLQWVNHLSGKLLTQMESYSGGGGGINATSRLLLRPNGRFEYAGSSLVSVDVGSSAAGGDRTAAAGWWRILTASNISYLGLAVDGVPQEIYSQLDMRGGQVHVDGRRTYVTLPR